MLVVPKFTPMMHQQTKQALLGVDNVWVCRKCQRFAVMREPDWACRYHDGQTTWAGKAWNWVGRKLAFTHSSELRMVTVSDPFRPASLDTVTIRPPNDPRQETWAKNYAENKPLVQKSVRDLPQADVVYLVGCGPSLEKNAAELQRVKYGAIITLNDSIEHVPKADYFLCIDHVFTRTKGNKDTTAILVPTVPHALAELPWKDVRWIKSSAQSDYKTPPVRGRWHRRLLHKLLVKSGVAVSPEPPKLVHRTHSEIHENHPDLWMYDEGLNCTFTAYQLISQIFRPQVLVLVGLDCAFSPDKERVGWNLEWSPKEQYVVVPGQDGKPLISNALYGRVISLTAASLAFYHRHRVRVINATEGGALPPTCIVEGVGPIDIAEWHKLSDVVDWANRAGEEKEKRNKEKACPPSTSSAPSMEPILK